MAKKIVLTGELIDTEGKSLTNTGPRKAIKRDIREYLSRDEVVEGLARIDNPRDQVFCTTLYMTGLRVSEVINLKKEDIDFTNSFITARWQKNRQWKNRRVALHPQLSPILRVFAAKLNEEELLFPFTRQRAFQITKKHFGVSPHKFRHTYAMHFLSSSGDPLKAMQLQRLLGHKRVQTTMEYVSLRPEDQLYALKDVNFL